MDAEAPNKKRKNEDAEASERKSSEANAPAVGFAPSRGRFLAATAAAGVALSQPSGKALPQLIVPPPASPQEHTAKAISLGVTGVLLALSQAPESVTAAYNSLSSHEVVVKRRAEALGELKTLSCMFFRSRCTTKTYRSMSGKLEEGGKQWVEALPKDSPAKGINFPLVQALATSLG